MARSGGEQRIGLIVFAARVKLRHVFDVYVGEAQRGYAHIRHQDENRGPDAVGLKADVQQQKRNQQHAAGHDHHAGRMVAARCGQSGCLRRAEGSTLHAGTARQPASGSSGQSISLSGVSGIIMISLMALRLPAWCAPTRRVCASGAGPAA